MVGLATGRGAPWSASRRGGCYAACSLVAVTVIGGISASPPRYVRVSASVETTRAAPASRYTCVLSSASAGGPQRPTRIRTSGSATWSLLTR
jgi:hypothetical protein